MHTEWELLVLSEDIETGDCLLVDDDGEEKNMIFIKMKTSQMIELLDTSGNKRLYSTQTLEEIGDAHSYITGKSEETISIKEIMKRKRKD